MWQNLAMGATQGLILAMMKEREGWTIGEATRNDVEDTIALHNALMLFPFRATLYLGPD